MGPRTCIDPPLIEQVAVCVQPAAPVLKKASHWKAAVLPMPAAITPVISPGQEAGASFFGRDPEHCRCAHRTSYVWNSVPLCHQTVTAGAKVATAEGRLV